MEAIMNLAHGQSDRKPRLIMIFAHGPDAKTIAGQCPSHRPEMHENGEKCEGHRNLVDLENVMVLRGAGVFAAACNCGQVLGLEIVKAGAKYFIGFTKRIIAPATHEESIGNCLRAGAQCLLEHPEEPESAMAVMADELKKLTDWWLKHSPTTDIGLGIAIEMLKEGLVVHPHNAQSVA
jgi:hypothetical protein